MKALRIIVPLLLLGVCAGLLIFNGCTETPIKHDLSGEITLDGEPVADGQIYFVSDKEKGNDGPNLNGVHIENGHYTTLNSGRAAPVGPARIRIEMSLDGAVFQYETTAELPPSPGIKDFAVAKSDTKRIQSLAAPSAGGGGGKAKAKAKKEPEKEKKEPEKDKTDQKK